MEEKLIKFHTAKLAKEKGFDIETDKLFVNYYSGNPEPPLIKWKNVSNEWYKEQLNFISTRYYQPTQSLLQKWLREVHNLHIEISRTYTTGLYVYQYFIDTENQLFGFQSYEEALEKGLEEALKLIK